MAQPWESAPQSHQPAPWESAPQSHQSGMGGYLQSIGNAFTGAVKQVGQDFANPTDTTPQYQKPVGQQIYDMTAAPIVNGIKTAGDVMNVVNAPLTAAVRPVGAAASNVLYDHGIKPNSIPTLTNPMAQPQQLSSSQAGDQMTNDLMTAASLAAPERGPGVRMADIPVIQPKPVVSRQVPVGPTPLPSVDDLRAAKTAAYNQADQVGAVYNPQASSDFVSGITQAAHDAGIDPDLNPKSSKILSKIQQFDGQPLSFSDLENKRKLINNNLANNPDGSERMFGNMFKEHIDNLINNASPQDMLAGDPVAQSQAINNARGMNVAYRKVEAINGALGKADLQAASSGSGGNIDNATRQKLRSLYQNKSYHWTPDEGAAFESVIRGGPVQNLMRLVGKLSPEGNGLMMAGQLAAGAVTHGASIPASLVGMAAKHGSEYMTATKANNLLRTVVDASPYTPAIAPPMKTVTPFRLPDMRAVPVLGELGQLSGMPHSLPAILPLQAAATTPPRKADRKK